MLLKRTPADLIFDGLNHAFLLLVFLICLYPLLHIAFGSISDPLFLKTHVGVLLYPHGFNFRAYQVVFKNGNILTGYRNTLILVIAGTSANLVMSSIGAYLLSRQRFRFRKYLMIMVIITMYFNGGLIPTFLIYKNVYHLYNNFFALILPGVISTWNMIIMKTSFQSIPSSLEESALIDGANDLTILTRIILPLSKATIAVMALFYGVGHWNSWFSAMVYLKDRELYPLQLILREILITNTDAAFGDEEEIAENIRYAAIIVATVPVLFIYPFIQKYFVKGVMVGAVKG